MTPTNDRLLVRRIADDPMLASGIVIPESAQRKPQRGQVLAVGPGRILKSGLRCPVGLSPGEYVLFGRHAGEELELDGEPVLILREDEVFGTVEAECGEKDTLSGGNGAAL